MSDTRLIAHCGARHVTLDQLQTVPCPAPSGRWRPIPHHVVYRDVLTQLADAGYVARSAQHALARDDKRYFATIDTELSLAPGVHLSIGLRSSLDKSLCLGFCAGSRVMVCDNLAFSGEIVAHRKHTVNGPERFREAVSEAIVNLAAFTTAERLRIERMRQTPLTDLQARGLILSAWEQEIVSERQLAPTLEGWSVQSENNPHPPSAWRLYNAFTGALATLARSNPQRFTRQTMALGRLLSSIPSGN